MSAKPILLAAILLQAFLVKAQIESRNTLKMPEEMRKEFLHELGLKKVTSFYLESPKKFVFAVKGHDTLERFELHSGSKPVFNFSKEAVVPARITDNEFSTELSLPSQIGGERFSFMPAVFSYEVLAMDEVKRINPKIATSRTEKSCSTFLNPFAENKSATDSVALCAYMPYVVVDVTLYGGKSFRCYQNFNTWEDASGLHELQYWFEPEGLGFVKFLLRYPHGQEILIELAKEPEIEKPR